MALQLITLPTVQAGQTLAQAEQITWAFQNFSNWKWVLRSPSNYNQPQAPTSGVSQNTFYAQYGLH